MYKFILSALITSFISISAWSQKVENAVEYNDYIIERQTQTGELMLEMGKAMNAMAPREDVEAIMDRIDSHLEKSIRELSALGAYKGNEAFVNSAIQLFKFYKSTVNKEYRQMVEVLYKENFSEEDMAELHEISERVAQQEEKYDTQFLKAQQEFAEENDMDLQQNKLQGEFE